MTYDAGDAGTRYNSAATPQARGSSTRHSQPAARRRARSSASANQPHAAALSAAWFYASLRGRGVDDMAVAGDVAGITKLVNGGNLGLDQRTALFNAALAVA